MEIKYCDICGMVVKVKTETDMHKFLKEEEKKYSGYSLGISFFSSTNMVFSEVRKEVQDVCQSCQMQIYEKVKLFIKQRLTAVKELKKLGV